MRQVHTYTNIIIDVNMYKHTGLYQISMCSLCILDFMIHCSLRYYGYDKIFVLIFKFMKIMEIFDQESLW